MKNMKILAIIYFVVLIIILYAMFVTYKETSPELKDMPSSTYLENALIIRVESLGSLANVAILILSGAWGLYFSKSSLSVKTFTYVLPLIISSIFLVGVYISYKLALQKYIEILISAKTFDMNAFIIQFWQTWQIILISCGFIMTTIYFFQFKEK